MKQTDDWLATMRSAWKAGIDRDEREQCAASTMRLVRCSEKVQSAGQPFREVLPLAVCVGACVLGGIALHHAATAPSTNGIRADETPETAPAVIVSAEPEPSPQAPTAIATASAAPAASTHAAPAAPPKAKSETKALPPLPPPPRPSPPERLPGRREHLRQILKAHGHRPLPLPHHAPKKHDRDL